MCARSTEPISFWSKVVGPVIILVGTAGGTIGTVQAVRGIISATANQTDVALGAADMDPDSFGPLALPTLF